LCRLTTYFDPDFMRGIMRRLLSFATALIVLVGVIGCPPSATAQRADVEAIFKRVQELLGAGNYPAALAEAQKFEAAAKAQYGINHTWYGVALGRLATAHQKLGHYAGSCACTI
jgi:hypothetical protein